METKDEFAEIRDKARKGAQEAERRGTRHARTRQKAEVDVGPRERGYPPGKEKTTSGAVLSDRLSLSLESVVSFLLQEQG